MCMELKNGSHYLTRSLGAVVKAMRDENGRWAYHVVASSVPNVPVGTRGPYANRMGHVHCRGRNGHCQTDPMDAMTEVNMIDVVSTDVLDQGWPPKVADNRDERDLIGVASLV